MSGETIIHSVLLFDGESIHPNATVTFDRDTGKVTSVRTEPTGDVAHPPSATVIDGRGHTLLPGLIESHIHVHQMHMPPGVTAPDPIQSPLKCGITTVCDMHCDPAVVKNLRARIADDIAEARKTGGTVNLSDLKSSLYAATIAGGWPKSIVLSHNPSEELKAFVDTWPSLTVENAKDFVQQHKAEGANYIKLMQENHCALILPTNSIPVATLELQTAVVNAAHQHGLRAAGHAFSVDMTEIVLKSGADGLTHTFFDQAPPQSTIDHYKEHNAFVIPTLGLIASVTKEHQDYRDTFADIAAAKGLLDEFSVKTLRETVGAASPEARFEYAIDSVRKLKAQGIDVLAGTDSAVGLQGLGLGPGLWLELQLYVDKCGFSATDALRSATSVQARRLDFVDRGLVAEGKRADLLLVKGNVTEDSSCLWKGDGVVGVWKEGIKAS
ncbi:hypothetical protein H2200_005135 [Cladophialophora chaetospira]|uniref:Amidohydrolase-related domain-containing protein n=1 Tax=Cladophialophora chaetospira TaxID=386627 RepID=A0AA38XBE4_9EURO|nr:hypothetical protein H2200_005135 [Cladophialophora chaetospira]